MQEHDGFGPQDDVFKVMVQRTLNPQRRQGSHGVVSATGEVHVTNVATWHMRRMRTAQQRAINRPEYSLLRAVHGVMSATAAKYGQTF